MHVPSLVPIGWLHVFVPVSLNRLKTNMYSNFEKFKEGNSASLHDEMDYENITGFVACEYD